MWCLRGKAHGRSRVGREALSSSSASVPEWSAPRSDPIYSHDLTGPSEQLKLYVLRHSHAQYHAMMGRWDRCVTVLRRSGVAFFMLAAVRICDVIYYLASPIRNVL